jgi:hypothetical protein
MDNFSAGQANDDRGFDRPPLAIGDRFDAVNADDNLGDEAAFPPTWQRLAGGDAQHD